ncbi:M20 family metallopeptidase [Ureibacillus manganicus]|uniref:Peptidase M20 dimerisation domain-containing protein n=1 Tax=Ureibacillus manganicus DSM 26584 TaxID=1384049 RepID=A0A0A3HYC0_9BACL|nr:M20 family metallopeptidase [Ureibacillus manganicus]KGR77606.1 hypothetical protein CD29_14205 [Ureibacillus manganicus DSM 26584]
MNDSLLKKVYNDIENKYEDSLNLLEIIVNIDSPTVNKEGVNLVGHEIRRKLESENIDYEILENENYGNHIIATIKGKKKGKILLMGHKDTALPDGTAKNRPFKITENHIAGPGVSDMKSGLVTMIQAASSLKNLAADEICDIQLLFTPDEELGSPISKSVITELAKDASCVFNLEPGRPDGSIVTARKGSAHLRIDIEGKAAHSGAFIENGISANDELAQKMIHIKKLMNIEDGITINFGKLNGGIGNNVVSPCAYTSIHLAFWKLEDYKKTYKEIEGIVNTSYIEGTKSKLSGDIGMLPMEKNEGVLKLLEIVKNAANYLDINITEQTTKGAADVGFTAALGIPSICGMGPIGGNWHAENEYMELNSLIPRTKLLASSILLFCKQL